MWRKADVNLRWVERVKYVKKRVYGTTLENSVWIFRTARGVRDAV